ncbi:MAG: tetratricopeptide repeat protein, partial [bacterium]|nr:tetratricopeptide repeat protein [bacterium]
IHNSKSNYDEAWAALEKAKKGSPDNLEVLYHEVNLLESSDRTGDAIARLEEILEGTKKTTYSNGERSNRTVFLERLGLLYRADEQYDRAVATFEELKDLDPKLKARVLVQIGDTLRQGKKFAEAAEVLNTAHKEFPDNRMIAIVRATVLADLGQADAAVAVVERLTAGKDDLESHVTRAQIYEKTKRFDKMAGVIDEALKIAVSDEEKSTVLFMQGAMYERLKDVDRAEAAFRKVLEINPDNSSAMNYLGYMFADQNIRLQEALGLIRKALDAEPQNGAYLDSLGWVYYRLDRLEEAARYLERAVKKVSRDPVVHDHLGDVYSGQGKLKEAINHWRISLQEWATSSAGEHDPVQIGRVEKKLEGAEVRLARESSSTPGKQP